MFFVYLFNYSMPCLRRLVAGLALQKHGFDFMSVNIEFLVDKLALRHVFPQEIRPHCHYSSTILSFSYLERRIFVMNVSRVKG